MENLGQVLKEGNGKATLDLCRGPDGLCKAREAGIKIVRGENGD